MGTKTNPAPNDCYIRAMPDEPMFVLLGRDLSAPEIVRDWAEMREVEIEDGIRPADERSTVQEARNLADAMEQWRADNDGKWREPENGGVPDRFVSRETVASFVERYAERLVEGPAIKDRITPLHRLRHSPEEASAVKIVLTSLAQSVRTGVDQPEADWPFVQTQTTDAPAMGVAPMTTDMTVLGIDRPAEFPLGDGLFRRRPSHVTALCITEEQAAKPKEDWPEWVQEMLEDPDANPAGAIGWWIVRDEAANIFTVSGEVFAATFDRVR